ncbi:MAG TPA: response regulator [Bacteroidales bacterium]|nr:response regulator [Bacteroidales bacterium]
MIDSKSKILIVDDRKENIIAMQTLLEELNVDIITASSGNEALATTLENDFALALIDVQMPEMDGYETVRLMRKVEKTRFLPVIFVSAIYSNDPYLIQGIEAGAVDFITKPFNPRILLGKIRIFLDMHLQKNLLEAEIERRILVEDQLTEAKLRAEESDRLKSAFIANMSHEIRTPLTTIVGMAGLLSEKDYLPDKKKEIAAHIEKNSESLLTIINDILDLSKIEAGEVKVNKRPVDIRKLLNELHQIFLQKLKRNNKISTVELRLNMNDESPVFPVTDENRLRQVLSNLLGNALKFTSAGFIEIGYKLGDGYIDLYVEDTGSGIPQEKMQVVFERFQKLNDFSVGTGLGLSIAKKLTDILGGQISVVSEINKGSKFIVSIPYTEIDLENKNQINTNPINQKRMADLSNKTLLIAEDEYPIYFLLETMLAPSNIKIKWARNGREALEVFKEEGNFDAVLLDIKMPEMDGIETFKEIRKVDKKVPVIAQTAYVMSEERAHLEEIGFSGFISKPFVRSEIIEMIDSLIQ